MCVPSALRGWPIWRPEVGLATYHSDHNQTITGNGTAISIYGTTTTTTTAGLRLKLSQDIGQRDCIICDNDKIFQDPAEPVLSCLLLKLLQSVKNNPLGIVVGHGYRSGLFRSQGPKGLDKRRRTQNSNSSGTLGTPSFHTINLFLQRK